MEPDSPADAGAARGQDGEHRADLERTGDQIGHDDDQRDDDRRDRQALDALREQHLQVELEAEQDDAQAQQLVGDQTGGVLDARLAGVVGADVEGTDRELDDHADEQGDDQRTEQRETVELLEERADEGGDQRQDGDEQHIGGRDALPPLGAELSHTSIEQRGPTSVK